jgi:hypothetical protein
MGKGVGRREATLGSMRAVGAVASVLVSSLLFMTAPALARAPVVSDESVSDVSAEGATLQAVVDPEGSATTYRFEYDTAAYSGSATHGTSAPAPDGSLGESTGAISVSVHIQDLRPDTTYHYRVVATDTGSPAPVTVGEDETFTTQQTGGEFVLPDGRQWEMVTPLNKHGAEIEPISEFGGVIQSAEAGNLLTYVASAPVVSEPAGNTSFEYSQLVAMRGPQGGWSTQNIATPHDEYSELPVGDKAEYKMFSSNLSFGLVEPLGDTPLPPLKPGAEKTIYLHDNATNSFQALVSEANVLPGARFGEASDAQGDIRFQGASPDLKHVVLSSEEALTPAEGSTPAAVAMRGNSNLYEWSAGRLKLVSVLPSGQSVAGLLGSSPSGAGSSIVRNAISEDGSRVVFGAGNHLYLRDMSKEETIMLDSPNTSELAVFEGANDSDSRIFFIDRYKLTAGGSPGGPDLYVAEVSETGGRLAVSLTDLTNDQVESAALAGTVIGYGTERDSDGNETANVYYEAGGALDARGTPGGNNLYVSHFNGVHWEQEPSFIADLSSDDYPSWGGPEFEEQFLPNLTSRVSPSGRYLAFMSNRRLTGYDNEDANSGAADEEVYLYDAKTDRIACASCNPTGSRPNGIFETGSRKLEKGLLVDEPESWGATHSEVDSWLAANIPGWTPISSDDALYQSRFLSDSGRLFFNSADALVPADVNGKEDVYEYEPEGSGREGARCEPDTTSASETFKQSRIFEVEGGKHEEPAGCVALISSGTSGQESAFLDASAQGPGGEEAEDVFFLTTSPLAEQDTDSAFDIYDAHECAAAAPCPTHVGSLPPACSDAASCRAAPSPQPALFGAPASATFFGRGNASASTNGTGSRRSRPLGRKQRLARALKLCAKDRSKAKRATCKGRAKRKYGPGKVKNTSRRAR